MRLLLLICTLFSLSNLSAQSNNMTLMGTLDGLNANYSDIWGYEHNGSEFAIIGSSNKINVVNVTDCSNPMHVYSWDSLTNTSWRDMKDYGDYIYGVNDVYGTHGLLIIKKDTFQEYQHDLPSGEFTKAHNIFIDKQHGRLYAVGSSLGNDYIGIYDLNSNPTNPTLLKVANLKNISQGSDSHYIHDLYVKDHIGYASHGYSGLKIWDFTDPNNILFLGGFNSSTSNYNHSSWLADDNKTLYVAYELPKGVPIQILDVSDPNNIHEIGSFKDPLLAPTHVNLRPHNPYVNGDYLYISYYMDGLKVYDICDPENPEFIAHYDSYPGNTDYNASNGFAGNWGVYPYLPSGCILMSDMQTGLYTVRLTNEPDEVMILHNQDLIFDGSSTNFLMRDLSEVDYNINIDLGLMTVVADTAFLSGSKAIVKNADIYFDTYGKGPVVKQGGQYYRIFIRSNGILNYELLAVPPATGLKASSELEMKNYKSGFILRDELNKCWKTYINDSGVLETELVECPN